MLKKLFLIGAASLLTLPAFAQNASTTITTTYPAATTIVVGNCTITGATQFAYNPSDNTLTPVGGSDSCDKSTTGNQTASVSVSLNTSSYTIGSNAAVPVLTVTSNTAAAVITCTLTPPSGSGITVTSNSTITASDSFTLSAPAVAGTWGLKPTCTTATTGYNAAVTSGSATLTVVANNPVTGCSASQTTTINGVTIQRQCTGTVVMNPSGTTYSGPLTDLGTVLGNTTFPNYSYGGQSPTFYVDAGSYVSLAFTPSVAGYVKWVANSSYGDGGIISVSTQPGVLTSGMAGAVCVYSGGALNNALVTTASGSCKVVAGTTYYMNFTDTNLNGQFLCFGSAAGSCSQSRISYGITTRAF